MVDIIDLLRKIIDPLELIGKTMEKYITRWIFVTSLRQVAKELTKADMMPLQGTLNG